MQLPSDAIGISDILDYRECPQRFAFKMRRHVPLPERFQLYEGERDEPPEATNWTNAYGSAVHDAIAVVEQEQVADDEAIRRIWPEYQGWLDPEDLDNMKRDLELYHTRSLTGYRLVAAEADMKVPLFVHNGRQIYFRFKVDALYQHMQNEGLFVSRDYKSSKWPKSEEEIKGDLQQWAYNWALHEMFPEIETLVQMYDMLRFGETPIRKNAEQRGQIKAWLIAQVTAILDDDSLKPKMNQWCPYCPILMDCRVVHRSADWWKARIEAIAPMRREGRKVVMELTDDSEGFAYYLELLPKVSIAKKALDRFEAEVKDALKAMPQERREELGYTTKSKKATVFPADALRRIHERTGGDFFHLIGLTKTKLEDFYGKGKAGDDESKQLRDHLIAEGNEIDGARMIVKK